MVWWKMNIFGRFVLIIQPHVGFKGDYHRTRVLSCSDAGLGLPCMVHLLSIRQRLINKTVNELS